MKPLTNIGGLVDFKENLIFEEYKNKVIPNANKFKQLIYKKYNIVISNDLHKKICNYQIKKYGSTLYFIDVTHKEYIRRFRDKTSHRRIKRIEINLRNEEAKMIIDKLEKRSKNESSII